MIHQLKSEKRFFEPVLYGKKKAEVRKNDRNFKVGDYIGLNEVIPVTGEHVKYTGRSMMLEITHILSDRRFVKDGYVVISFETCSVSCHSRNFLDNMAEISVCEDFRLVTKEYKNGE